MTQQEWLAEVQRRIGISEGCRATMYHDSVGVPTIGVGFNLQRSDAWAALRQSGVADVGGVMNGHVALTDEQIAKLFAYSFAPILSEARASLAEGVFDRLSDARRFVICDLVFNLGYEGWLSFYGTRSFINAAQNAIDAGNPDEGHARFGQAAAHLESSAWYNQVGNRAKRDVAMIRSSEWCDAEGDGSDVS